MELNVAYSSDDNYCCHLGTSILSLIMNNKEFSRINIYILDNGISFANKKKLNSIIEKHPVKMIFCDFSRISSKLNTDNKFSICSFGRLFLDDFVDEDKVLYLDCDSVINGSFIDLFNQDMEDYFCFGVQDSVEGLYKTRVGMKKDDVYYNAGFLLINLKYWREEKLQEKAISMIEKYNGSVPHHDQGVINSICYHRIKRIHPKYNFLCNMFEYSPNELSKMIPNYYSENEIIEANENPVFIHFTESYSNRPWRITCTHPYKDLYLYYRNQTPFKGELENHQINKKSAFIRKMYNKLPFSVFRLIMIIISKKKSISYLIRK